jgi:hypothetical protein
MNWESVEGWFDGSDVHEYRRIVSKYTNANFVEIGCWKGRSFSSIMPVLLNNNYKNIYAVDHWMGSVDEREGDHAEAVKHDIFPQFVENVASCGFDNQYKVIRGDSAEVADQFEDGYFDVVFIDADHEYDGFKKDIEKWLPKVKKGGTLCGHDAYHKPIVKVLVEKFSFTWYRPSVGTVWSYVV